MAKSNKKKGFDAKIEGILNIDNDIIEIEDENCGEITKLSDFIREFDGKDVKISVTYASEI